MLFPRAAEKMRCIVVYYLKYTGGLRLDWGLNLDLSLFCAGAILTGAGVSNHSKMVGLLVPAFAKLEVQSSARSWEVLAAARSGNREILPLKEWNAADQQDYTST